MKRMTFLGLSAAGELVGLVKDSLSMRRTNSAGWQISAGCLWPGNTTLSDTPTPPPHRCTHTAFTYLDTLHYTIPLTPPNAPMHFLCNTSCVCMYVCMAVWGIQSCEARTTGSTPSWGRQGCISAELLQPVLLLPQSLLSGECITAWRSSVSGSKGAIKKAFHALTSGQKQNIHASMRA